MLVTVLVSNKETDVSAEQLWNRLVIFVTELAFAPSTSTRDFCPLHKELQSVFWYVKSHTFGVELTRVEVPLENDGVLLLLNFKRIVYSGKYIGF